MVEAPTISVIVPTYRRPDVLKTCLAALHAQTLPPMEILVCRRITDVLTGDALAVMPSEERHLVREVIIGPDDNLTMAMNAAIHVSQGDYVAFTDDDAEAPADWLQLLLAGFTDEKIAGVGGRDILAGAESCACVVGMVTWYGKVIGNHHIGTGPARNVDVLKGVNCCYRGDLLRQVGVDQRLRGRGNVVHCELAICLALRREGWRLIYNPSITVMHRIAPRGDGDTNNRGGFDAPAMIDAVHNQTVLLVEHLSPFRRAAFRAWSSILGTRATPGVFRIMLPTVLPPRFARWMAGRAGRKLARASVTLCAASRESTAIAAAITRDAKV